MNIIFVCCCRFCKGTDRSQSYNFYGEIRYVKSIHYESLMLFCDYSALIYPFFVIFAVSYG